MIVTQTMYGSPTRARSRVGTEWISTANFSSSLSLSRWVWIVAEPLSVYLPILIRSSVPTSPASAVPRWVLSRMSMSFWITVGRSPYMTVAVMVTGSPSRTRSAEADRDTVYVASNGVPMPTAQGPMP